jgi:hypothetical protein
MEKYHKLWASRSNITNSPQISPSNQAPTNANEENVGSARAALELVLVNSSARVVCTEEKEEGVYIASLPTDPA